MICIFIVCLCNRWRMTEVKCIPLSLLLAHLTIRLCAMCDMRNMALKRCCDSWMRCICRSCRGAVGGVSIDSRSPYHTRRIWVYSQCQRSTLESKTARETMREMRKGKWAQGEVTEQHAYSIPPLPYSLNIWFKYAFALRCKVIIRFYF